MSTATAKVGQPAPDFNLPSTKNIQTLGENVKLADYKVKWVVLWFYPLDFTFVCPTELTAFSDQFKEAGLRVIAVQMPRYEADTNLDAVREAVTTYDITTYDITEPYAVDNLHKLRDAFQNEQGFVPAYYLFDAEGKLKSFAAGERGTAMLGAVLNRVLGIQP